jgi:hypothetical protein
MKINLAHLHHQGIDFAVFAADASVSSNPARDELLSDLVIAARQRGLKIDKAALAFRSGGRTTFFGTPDLVRFLSKLGMPRWTHSITI